MLELGIDFLTLGGSLLKHLLLWWRNSHYSQLFQLIGQIKSLQGHYSRNNSTQCSFVAVIIIQYLAFGKILEPQLKNVTGSCKKNFHGLFIDCSTNSTVAGSSYTHMHYSALACLYRSTNTHFQMYGSKGKVQRKTSHLGIHSYANVQNHESETFQ